MTRSEREARCQKGELVTYKSSDTSIVCIHYSFILRLCRKVDAGVYTISAENCSGSASLSVLCKVLDAPGMPDGPCVFSNVMADRVTVSWKAPCEDGGAPVSNYVIEK